MHIPYIKKILLISLVLVAVTSCKHEKKEDIVNADPEKLFQQGVQQVIKHDYSDAINTFESIEREHPASSFAAEANIRRMYVYYLKGKYDDGIVAAEEFIKNYPAHGNIDYAYYMLALCYYDQIIDISRDQENTRKAISALLEVRQRFPDSAYARDAQYKLDLAYSNLAGKEMDIGFYYLKQKNYSAAVLRFTEVIQNPDYQRTIFTPEALFRLVEVNYIMGLQEEAKKYAAILGHNHPNSRWYQRAYDILNTSKVLKDMHSAKIELNDAKGEEQAY